MDNEPLVKDYSNKQDNIIVKYVTGISEHWKLTDRGILTTELFDEANYWAKVDDLIAKKAPIVYEFDYNQLDDESKLSESLFKLPYEAWATANFLEQRFSIQRLIKQILTEPFIKSHYPSEALIEDYQALQNLDLAAAHKRPNRSFTLSCPASAVSTGSRLVEAFSDWSETLIASWKSAFTLNKAINLLLRLRKPVTKRAMCLIMAKTRFTRSSRQYIPVSAYKFLIKEFGLSNCILADPNPLFCIKALAAVAEGCSYYSTNNFLELGKFLGKPFGLLEDRQSYDGVLLDMNFSTSTPLSLLEEWREKADVTIAFSKLADIDNFPKPDKILKIYQICDKFDYLLYYV